MLGPELLSIVALTITVLDLKEKHDRLAQQVSTSTSAARTDTLTGLLNRRAFDLDLDAVASGHAFAVVLIDLDGFKAINDRPGHALDDTLLRGYGCWLTRVLGPWGQVYRMGGDEYVLLVTAFPGPPDRFAAWAHERLQIPFVDGVSASIGVAWRGEAETVSDVIRLADQRMYRAKAARSTPHAIIDPGDRLAGLTDRSNRHATRAARSSTGAVRMTSPGEHPASR